MPMTPFSETTRQDSVPPADLRTCIHDLRNALAPILTGIEILRIKNPQPDQVKTINMMANQLDLLTDILNFHSGDTPVANPPSPESHLGPASTADSSANASPETVLVIDDNPNIIASLKMMFEDRGYEVLAAINAENAVELTSQFQPDICLCDLSLPAMDGIAAAAELLRANPAMRMFSMSGLGDQTDRDQSREAGFRAHFIKPIPFEEMIRVIENDSAARA
jgi:CheY-like chemotaxis protein